MSHLSSPYSRTSVNAALGIEATSSMPEQLADYIKSEAAKFAKVIKDAGIKVE